MSKGAATAVLLIFALGGVAIALWGWTDIHMARAAMAACTPATIDSSAFYFLGLCCLPLLVTLRFFPERAHGAVLAMTIGLFIVLPGLAYFELKSSITAQDFRFEPELSLFQFTNSEGIPGPNCNPA